jgi:hypothetical protein
MALRPMSSKLQFHIRWLLMAIAIIATALAMIRHAFPGAWVASQCEEGTKLIEVYRALVPPHVAPNEWKQAVDNLESDWATFVIHEHASLAEIAELLALTKALARRANRASAEGDLQFIWDRIDHTENNRPERIRETSNQAVANSRMFPCSIAPWPTLYKHSRLLIVDAPGVDSGIVAYAWKFVGKHAVDPLADLSAGLSSPEWAVRVCACRALRMVGLNGRKDEVVAALMPALRDQDQFIRELVIESLLRLRPLPQSVVPAIADVSIHDRSAQVREGAEFLLSQMAGPRQKN